jgi:hypothetical protein
MKLLLVLALLCSSEGDTSRVARGTAGFTLQIPAGWHVVPPQIKEGQTESASTVLAGGVWLNKAGLEGTLIVSPLAAEPARPLALEHGCDGWARTRRPNDLENPEVRPISTRFGPGCEMNFARRVNGRWGSRTVHHREWLVPFTPETLIDVTCIALRHTPSVLTDCDAALASIEKE